MRNGLIIAVLLLSGCSETPQRPERERPSPGSLPEHPSALRFEEVSYQVPEAADYRHELIGDSVAYIVEDDTLPLVEITFWAPVGDFVVPADQAGLATLTGVMLRQGGTQELSADELDERLDFLATEIGIGIGSTSASATLDSLSANLDESLDLLFDMLTEPRLDATRLQINQGRMLEGMRRRNDDTRTIEPRVWSELLYGPEFFVNHVSTQTSVEGVSEQAMRDLTQRVFAQGGLVVAASGAIEAASLVEKLNDALARLPQRAEAPDIPREVQPAAPGLYGVAKNDVNQTRVSIGHPGVLAGHPDEHALRVANFVLGGGGFISRITQRVRSDEGLAYSAGSRYSFGVYFPGEFRAYLQSKNASVPRAIGIVLQELAALRETSITAEELNVARQGTVAYLADVFDSPSGRARRFAQDHLLGRDHSYWRNFERDILAVTAEDVLRVAREHLVPEQLRILLVGNLDEVGRTAVEEVVGATLEELPLRDPLTNQPL